MSTKSIGDAQNTSVRVVLWKSCENPASAAQLRAAEPAAIAFFDGWCAYCGKRKPVHFDHAIPINRGYIGQHCIGNRIPACGECNSAKGGSQDFREFLNGRADGKSRTIKILAWMGANDYLPPPVGGDPKARVILETLRSTIETAINEATTAMRHRHYASP